MRPTPLSCRSLVLALGLSVLAVPLAAQNRRTAPARPTLPTITSVLIAGTPTDVRITLPVAQEHEVRDSTDQASRQLVLSITGVHAASDVRRMVRRSSLAAVRVSPRGDSAVVVVLELTDLVPYRIVRNETDLQVLIPGVGEVVPQQAINLTPDERVATITEPKKTAAGRSMGTVDLTADDASGTADQRTRERLKDWEAAAPARVTATWDQTPLRDVLALIARLTGRSVAPGTGIEGVTVSGDYLDARWTDVLVSIARINGMRLRVSAGDILTVESASAVVKADEATTLESRVVKLGYAKVAEVLPVLEKNLSKRGSATGMPEGRTVVISDTPDGLERALQLVRLLDRPDQSVRINYMVVSVDRSIARDLGVILDAADRRGGNALGGIPVPVIQSETDGAQNIIYGPMSGDPRYFNLTKDRASGAMASPLPSPMSPTFKFMANAIAGNYSLTALVQALETQRMAKVVARQEGIVREGREFKGSSAEETPLRVQGFTGTNGTGGSGGAGTGGAGGGGGMSTLGAGASGGGAGGMPFNSVGLVSTGIKLNATPTIEPDSMIALEIKVERSTAVPSGLGDAGVQFLRNEYSTSLRARSGETVVLGGLRDRVEGEQTAGIPVLSKIPWLGKLFSSRSRTGSERELLILVTAVIE